jgi:peptidoglycan/LPS O-acetylase OafA/YrhL
LQIFKRLNYPLNWYSIGLISLCFTILISYLSYHYFEIFFLNLKKRYAGFGLQKQFA